MSYSKKPSRKNIAIGFLGTKLDAGYGDQRWKKWRPTVALCSQEQFAIDEVQLLHVAWATPLAEQIAQDIIKVSPQTQVVLNQFNLNDPWNFEEVYTKLYDWCKQFTFIPEDNDYLFHMTTGTHVSQICSFLLTESRHFPGKLLQTAPPDNGGIVGRSQIIDLDLSCYDQLASRFDVEHKEGEAFLKGGINTKNPQFNQLIAQIEKVAIRSCEPILLRGPTGAGKSQLASRIYQFKKRRGTVEGQFVAVNCATLKGENAMAALFGHTKGAFTGAQSARNGFLLSAHHGVLFLDEIGELGLDEQAMLLNAIERKSFYPVGSDTQVASDFQLIVGTNRDLLKQVELGAFREDLLARINLWDYELPGLKQRPEDIAPNLDFELEQYAQKIGDRITFSKESRERFLNFATSPQALWRGNFRDLKAAVIRMCTLADSARIGISLVDQEIQRLISTWGLLHTKTGNSQVTQQILGETSCQQLDSFDLHQLEYVLNICQQHKSLAAAGRELFNVSRTQKASNNDSSRLQKYLAKFGIQWDMVN